MCHCVVLLLCVVAQATESEPWLEDLERQDTMPQDTPPPSSEATRGRLVNTVGFFSKVKQEISSLTSCYENGCRLTEGPHPGTLNFTTLDQSNNHLHDTAYLCPHRGWFAWDLQTGRFAWSRQDNTKSFLKKHPDKLGLLDTLTQTSQWRLEAKHGQKMDEAEYFFIYNKNKLVSEPGWSKTNITEQPRSECLCVNPDLCEFGGLHLVQNKWHVPNCGAWSSFCKWRPWSRQPSKTLVNVGYLNHLKYN